MFNPANFRISTSLSRKIFESNRFNAANPPPSKGNAGPLGEDAAAKDAENRRKLERSKPANAKRSNASCPGAATISAGAVALAEQLYRNQIRLQTTEHEARMRLLERERDLTERILQKQGELFELRSPAGPQREQAALLVELLGSIRATDTELDQLASTISTARLELQQAQQAPPAMQVNPGLAMPQWGWACWWWLERQCTAVGCCCSLRGRHGWFVWIPDDVHRQAVQQLCRSSQAVAERWRLYQRCGGSVSVPVNDLGSCRQGN